MNRTMCWLAATALLLCSANGLQCAGEPVVTKDMALKAITLFRQADPMSEEARGCAGIVMRYTERDPSVRFRLSPKNTSFCLAKGMPVKVRSILLGAYLVGNLDSCILRGSVTDDPYSGELQVIETYHRIQKKQPKLRVAEIEKMIDLERRGELKKYVSAP